MPSYKLGDFRITITAHYLQISDLLHGAIVRLPLAPLDGAGIDGDLAPFYQGLGGNGGQFTINGYRLIFGWQVFHGQPLGQIDLYAMNGEDPGPVLYFNHNYTERVIRALMTIGQGGVVEADPEPVADGNENEAEAAAPVVNNDPQDVPQVNEPAQDPAPAGGRRRRRTVRKHARKHRHTRRN